ncbi:putative carboxypeptidase A-like protein, partial [Operophtera brumata]
MWLRLILLGVLSVAASEKVRYDNYALYKVHPQSDEHLTFLKDLQGTDEALDFWKPATFDAQLYSRRKRNTRNNELYWTNYQSLEEIQDWFNHLAEVHSDIVTVVSAGASHEGRNITGIKIARGNPNRAFFLEAGQVAADWLSPTVLTYLVDQLVKGEDPEAMRASEEFEWHIFPIVNPDGFHFSQESVRLWVKNRRPITSTAIGVDLSKNWNSQWGANNYIGIGPFSEVETRQLSQYVDSIGSRLTGFLSFRSFGQRLVLPFAHTTEPLYNYNEMITIGRRAMGSMAVKYDTQYLVGTSKEVL